MKKYGFSTPHLSVDPLANTNIIVVIPCFNEPDVVTSINAIALCNLPKANVEIIVVLNSGEHHDNTIKVQNRKSFLQIQDWLKASDQLNISVHIIEVENLPKKHAGVGLARKIGMDEAVYRFEKISTDGIIVCFDADSTCDPNYLVEIEKHFENNSISPGCSIYFEHPIEKVEFDETILNAICQYELHLRYYYQALKYCGLPYAFHTVGSSMAVKSSAYQKQGGMNKRKAGEDFYFLHKIIALGNFTELNTTRVIPSPRISDRVPFGTGKAIGEMISKNQNCYFTYNVKSFLLIKKWVDYLTLLNGAENIDLSQLNLTLKEREVLSIFLENEKFNVVLKEVNRNTVSEKSFLRRMFSWFDAFKVLKMVHFLRDEIYSDQPVETESLELLKLLHQDSHLENCTEILTTYRIMEVNRHKE